MRATHYVEGMGHAISRAHYTEVHSERNGSLTVTKALLHYRNLNLVTCANLNAWSHSEKLCSPRSVARDTVDTQPGLLFRDHQGGHLFPVSTEKTVPLWIGSWMDILIFKKPYLEVGTFTCQKLHHNFFPYSWVTCFKSGSNKFLKRLNPIFILYCFTGDRITAVMGAMWEIIKLIFQYWIIYLNPLSCVFCCTSVNSWQCTCKRFTCNILILRWGLTLEPNQGWMTIPRTFQVFPKG